MGPVQQNPDYPRAIIIQTALAWRGLDRETSIPVTFISSI